MMKVRDKHLMLIICDCDRAGDEAHLKGCRWIKYMMDDVKILEGSLN